MVRFLTLSEILLIYEDQIRRYGGTYSVRNITLLSSAIYVPQATFGGEFIHKTIPEMATAYAFHICENHALVDGNKRVALASALAFLDINDFDFECSEDEIYQVMMDVASGNMKKDELVDIFMQYSKKRK
jgi:death-on-curing protein